MDDYIRREDALKCVSIDGCDGCSSYADCADRNTEKACSDCLYTDISRIPAADVEEVVRCKDCNYWASTLTPEEREELVESICGDGVCDYWECDGICATDYCSQAVRRTDDGH